MDVDCGGRQGRARRRQPVESARNSPLRTRCSHDREDDRKEVHAVTDGTVGEGYSRYHSREQGRDDACDDGHDHSETFTLAPIDGQLGGTDSWEELYM